MSTYKNIPISPSKGFAHCRSHGETLPIEDFIAATLSANKARGVCKTCWADYMKARRNGDAPAARRITLAELTFDVQHLHAFAVRMTTLLEAVVRDLPLPSEAALQAVGALRPALQALEVNLNSFKAARLSEQGLAPETEKALPKPVKAAEPLTELEAELASASKPVPDAFPGGLQDLPDGATEDDYARAQVLAEDHAESLHAGAITVGPPVAEQITAGPVYGTLPTPQTEILLGANKVVTDLDPSKEEF